MCRECAARPPLELPASGVFLSDGGELSYAGVDYAQVAPLLAGGIPARGYVAIAKSGANGRWLSTRLDAATISEARRTTSHLCTKANAPIVLGEVARMGGDPLAPTFLINALNVYEPLDKATLLRKAIRASDDVVGKLDVLRKAEVIDVFDPASVDILVGRLMKQIEQTVGRIPADTISKLVRTTGFNFATATDAQLMQYSRRLNHILRSALGGPIWSEMSDRFTATMKAVGDSSVESVVKRFGHFTSASLEQRDYRALERMGKAQTTYVKNHWGETSQWASERARFYVKRGQQDGLGSREIGAHLARRLSSDVRGRTLNYWTTVSDAAVARARTFGVLRTYQSMQIQVVYVSAVLDEATTEFCRMMDGKTMIVDQSLSSYEKADAGEPEDVKFTQPWVYERKIADGPHKGQTGMFMRTPGGYRRLGVAHSTAAGTQGVGKYTSIGVKNMTKAGLGPPPWHGHCRTIIVPDTQEVKVPTAQPAPRNKVPAAAKPMPMPRGDKGVLHPTQMIADGMSKNPSAGVTVPLDDQHVSDHRVSFRHEKVDGKDYTMVRFRVPRAKRAQVLDMMRAKLGARQETFHFESTSGSYKPGKTISKQSDRVSETGYNCASATTGGTRVRFITDHSSNAMVNTVEMRIPGRDVNKTFETYSRITEQLGFKGAGYYPSTEARRAAMQARIITQWDLRAGKFLRETTDLSPAAIDRVFEKVATEQPVVRRVLKDMQRAEVAPGHKAFYSKTQAEEIAKQGIVDLYQDGGGRHIVKVLGGDGLLPSVERFGRGVFTNGMSTSADFKTGGARGVFLRATAPGAPRYTIPWERKVRWVIDKNQLGRSDWWAYNHDNYGETSLAEHGMRSTAREVGTKVQTGKSSNEVMFEGGIPVSALKNVIVKDPTLRADIIKRLTEAGITEVNGKSIEKFILKGEPSRWSGSRKR